MEESLGKTDLTFGRGGWEKVTRLYRNQEIAEERCWVHGPDWCLAYD